MTLQSTIIDKINEAIADCENIDNTPFKEKILENLKNTRFLLSREEVSECLPLSEEEMDMIDDGVDHEAVICYMRRTGESFYKSKKMRDAYSFKIKEIKNGVTESSHYS